MITPSMTLAFREAIDGGKGDLDAWLEVNSEAEVREHIKTLIKSETKELVEALEMLLNPHHEGQIAVRPEAAGYVQAVIDRGELIIAKHRRQG